MKTKSTNYRQDRAFTEFVHKHLALPQVYSLLGWSPFHLRSHEKQELDLHHGIDRVFYTDEGLLVTVQERFRTSAYTKYQDVTFRYRRDRHSDAARRYSEFYKIQADYFLYGMVDRPSKNTDQLSGFCKVALLNLPPLWKKLQTGEAFIDEARTGRCHWHHDRMIIPVNHNRDRSSSFIAWDIPLIAQHWPQEILVYQRGFIP
uniref:Uncharacterized protein n=1 Tax=Roseihalotalea indica TaxID=2867963 RepID=A0AA49GR36_9BACT|nr:hypothetical protein K4G66_09760 [Tunicatimonas sp. TK19036]